MSSEALPDDPSRGFNAWADREALSIALMGDRIAIARFAWHSALAQSDARTQACLDAAVRHCVAQCAAAVRATPTFEWAEGSDQWGNPCPAKVLTTREQYAKSVESTPTGAKKFLP